MLKQSRTSRRLLAAAVAVPALAGGSFIHAATVIPASDDVSVRPSNSNRNADGLFIKNASGSGNFGSDAVGYMEFAVPKATYPTGVRSATLTVVPTAMYFVQTTGSPYTLQSYNPQMNFRIFGLPDGHPNENFDETTFRGNGWASLNTDVSAVNVGVTAANNANNQHGEFSNGFTLNPRPTDNPPYYTATPGWIAVDLGAASVSDANAAGADDFTYTYLSATQADVANKTPGADGVPDASQENMAGVAGNNLTFDATDFINTFDNNGTVTMVLWRQTEGDGGASFFLREPTLTVEPGLPVFWDINGTAAGAGGEAPAGTWDGTASNFNSDSTGAAGGFLTPLVTAADTAVFGAGGDATGAYTVTLSGARKAWQVSIEDGNVTLSGGSLATRTVDVASGASGTINSVLTGAGPTGALVKTGAGALTLGAVNTYGGGTTVDGGMLIVANADALGAGALAINDATAQAQVGLPKAIKLAGITTTGSGKLDLTDNKLITSDAPGTATAGVYNGIQGKVQTARTGGTWTGPGLTSSSAAAIPPGNATTSIGVATGAQIRPALAADPNATDLFAGQTINGASTIAMYTYGGDANLDGIVSGDDYAKIDFAIAVPGADGWNNGDFNYDGIISADDYTVIDFNIVAQGAPFSTGGSAGSAVSAVPEPAAGLIGLLLAPMAMRRRRR